MDVAAHILNVVGSLERQYKKMNAQLPDVEERANLLREALEAVKGNDPRASPFWSRRAASSSLRSGPDVPPEDRESARGPLSPHGPAGRPRRGRLHPAPAQHLPRARGRSLPQRHHPSLYDAPRTIRARREEPGPHRRDRVPHSRWEPLRELRCDGPPDRSSCVIRAGHGGSRRRLCQLQSGHYWNRAHTCSRSSYDGSSYDGGGSMHGLRHRRPYTPEVNIQSRSCYDGWGSLHGLRHCRPHGPDVGIQSHPCRDRRGPLHGLRHRRPPTVATCFYFRARPCFHPGRSLYGLRSAAASAVPAN
jgi:hypothetical protein